MVTNRTCDHSDSGNRPAPPWPTAYRVEFAANRDQVFKAFSAVANLAEKASEGRIRITIEATQPQGFDPAWLRNAVEEPLDEADIVTATNQDTGTT